MSPHTEIYVLSAFLYSVALLVLFLRTKTIFTPFHLCLAFFIGELVLAAFPLMQDDSYGRTKISAPHPETIWILLGAGLLMGLSNVAIRCNQPYALEQYTVETRVPRNLLVFSFVGLCLLASVRSLLKLGTFPLFVIARDSAGYGDVFEGFVTYLGWGAGRSLAVWVTLEGTMWAGGLLAFIRQKYILCAGAVFGITLNVLDGQRNLLIGPFLICIFALSRGRKIRLHHLAVSGIAILLFFTAVGAFRMGEANKASLRIKEVTHVPAVDNAIGSVVTYLEPNIDNLNNLIRLHPQLSFGKVILYGIVPDSLLNHFMVAPENALERLTNAGMLSYPGLTFRTIFADLYVDFGAVGSVLITGMLYFMGVYSFNRAGRSPRLMLTYLILALGIMNFPTLNTMVGIPALVQLSLFFLLRFRDTSQEAYPYGAGA